MGDFDTSRYLTFLGSTAFGKDILVFPELDSTNSWLKTAQSSQLVHGTICLTDRQLKGRGQYERSWTSEACANLTFSYLFRPESHDRLFLLTLGCICAVATVLDTEFGLNTSIKWPNDLMVADKKVAGILAEAVFNGSRLDRFIVGIGLNVNQQTFPDFLSHATSLTLAIGSRIEREQLLALIVTQTGYTLEAWQRDDPQLVASINRRLQGYGESVHIQVDGIMHDEPWIMLGVDNHGHLHLLDHEHNAHSFAYEQIRVFPDSV